MNKNIIRMVAIAATLFALLWIVGFGWAITENYAAKPDKIASVNTIVKKPANKKGLTVVALGDSLTRGTGDETGKGYVGDVIDEINKKTKQKTTLLNLGVNGQRSNQLKQQIQQKEVQRQIASADILLVTMGGNDLFRGGQGLVDYNTKSIAVTEKKYLDNVAFIFQKIRQANDHATVFMVGLYNPFIELDHGKEMSKVVRRWNFDTADLCANYPKIIFVPTFDLFELKVNDYLYSDKFHPNTKGYRLIAERVAALLTW